MIKLLIDISLQMPGNAVLFAVLAAIAIHRPAAKHQSNGHLQLIS